MEIVQFGLTFGKITNVLNLRKKNQVNFLNLIEDKRKRSFLAQAFLEFDSVEHAQAMTDHFASIPILLNGRQIFVQFSNHQELKTDPNNANNQQAQAALQSATGLQEIGRAGGPNCVLRVVVSNVVYSVNVETFHQVRRRYFLRKDTSDLLPSTLQIFSKFGVVLKIITFTKNGKKKDCLVENAAFCLVSR